MNPTIEQLAEDAAAKTLGYQSAKDVIVRDESAWRGRTKLFLSFLSAVHAGPLKGVGESLRDAASNIDGIIDGKDIPSIVILANANAALRKPENMKRGGADHYSKLGAMPCAPGKKRGRPLGSKIAPNRPTPPAPKKS